MPSTPTQTLSLVPSAGLKLSQKAIVWLGKPAKGNDLLLFDKLVSTARPATVVSNVTNPFLLTQNLLTGLPANEEANGIATFGDHRFVEALPPAL